MTRKISLPVVLMVFTLCLLAFMTVYPLGMIVYGSLRSGPPGLQGSTWSLNGYISGFSDPSIARALWNTFWIAFIRQAIALALGIFFTWLVIRTDLPFKGPLETLFWLNYFLPNMPMVFGWIQLLDPDYGFVNQMWRSLPFTDGPLLNIYSYAGIIWAHTANGVATKVLLFGPAFINMDAALEDSARMSGSSNIWTLIKITFPILLPAIMGVTFLGFIHSLESFETELLLGLPAKIFVYSTKVYELLRWEPPQYPPAMALSMVFMVAIGILVLIQRSQMAKRQYTTVTGRGFNVRPISLGTMKWPLFGFTALFIAVTTFLPFTFLIIGTFMKVLGLFMVAEPFTLKHWIAVFKDPMLLKSIRNSLMLATGVAVMSSILNTLLSYIIVRTKLAGRGILEVMTWLPWALPGMLISLGILWVFLGGIVPLKFFYGTLPIIGFAMLITGLPIGVRLMNGTMIQLGKELEESARVLGASWTYTFRHIVVPLLLPSMTTLAFISFLHAMVNVQTVVLLYSAKSRVLSVLMLEYYIGHSPEKGMIIGVMISLFAFAIAALARGFRIRLR